MESIKNYEILEKVDETRGGLIYRARKKGVKREVIIKALKTLRPSPSDMARFKQEYKLIKSIGSKGVIKTYDIIEHQGGVALVLEDFGGISIKEALKQKKFDIRSFLETAIQISETLGQIHQENMIHRDIKPHNILINNNNGEVKLTDFGIATILTRQNDEIYDPEVIQGTLAYMSPEQTGRMNRPVDYRTDLYSLGITFYEMLTGAPPFMSHDPMEVIHSHIAIMPPPPNEKQTAIPAVISDITLRLLLKNAEERYQNSFGLMADLKECLKQFREKEDISPFPLAQKDISNRFNIPLKLYGREKELDVLMSTFEKVCTSPLPSLGGVRGKQNELMLVTGPPGIGKSALVNEIHKPIVAKRGYFISGKYDQFNKDRPYSAIIQAFQMLVRQILSESEDKIQSWKMDLLEALGLNGKVITDIIPEVELIIGEQARIPELGPQESRNRFNIVFEKFMSVFPKPEHPVALFLDDLQWADMASLQMINDLVRSPYITHLFIIGACRDNEISNTHPLVHILDEIEQEDIRLHTITIAPLTLKHVCRMIVDFLKCSEDEGAQLGEVVFKKTGGNPFFVNQFLKTLYDEKMIQLDPEAGWQWDLEKIRQRQVTDNLVELLVEKINKLSEGTREALKICACIGNHFDLETFSYILGKSIDETLNDLIEAVNEGLIDGSENIYFYHHDRIREAAYSLIPNEEKGALHYRIGKLTLEKADEKVLDEKIFYIVDQLNYGSECIKGKEERVQIVRLNLAAGKRAKASAAYFPASRYLASGIGFLEADAWKSQYDLALEIYAEAIETASIIGDLYQMNALLDTAMAHARDVIDQTLILRSKIYGTRAQGDLPGAISIGLDALKLLDIHLSRKDTRTDVIKELAWAKEALEGKTDQGLLNLPDITDAGMLSAVRILASLSTAAFLGEPAIYPLITLKALNILLRYGNNPFSAIIYNNFGVILTTLGDIEGGYRFGNLAQQIIDKYHAVGLKSGVMFSYNMLIRHWKEHLKESIAAGLEGYQIGMETGNLEFAAYNLFMHDTYSQVMGVPLDEVERHMVKHHRIIKQLKQKHVLNHHALWLQYILNLMGKSDDPLVLTGSAFDERAAEKEFLQTSNHNSLCNFYYAKAQLYSFFDQHARALEYIEQAEKYQAGVKGVTTSIGINFLGSLFRLAMYQQAPKDKQALYLQKVSENQSLLKKWADINPANFMHRFHIVESELSRVLKDVGRAIDAYDQAIVSSNKNQCLREEAIANELAAKFYLTRGNEKIAGVYMMDAYDCYSRWGAEVKVRQLIKTYPALLSSMQTAPARGVPDVCRTMTATDRTSNTLDFSTIMKASQTISGEIVLGRLLDKMMKIMVENAGAEKGIMIFADSGRFIVEAEWAIGEEDFPVIKSVPVDSHGGLSVAMVHYVERTKEVLILNDATKEGRFINDPYVVRHRPKSILCMPLVRQSQLIGVLYMENNIASGAFTAERVEILSILSSQAVISLENARLYENVKRAREKVQNLLEAANEGFWQVDNKGITMDVNPEMCAILGRPRDEIIGRSIFEFGTGRYIDIVRSQPEIWEKQSKSAYEASVVRPDGTEVLCLIKTAPLFEEDKRVGSFGMVTDITERKQAEEEVKRINAELEDRVRKRTEELNEKVKEVERANKAKSDFLANMSHEIRTPMNAVIGFTDVLMDTPLNMDQRDYLKTIKASGEGLVSLINDILDLSKIEAGEMDFEELDFEPEQLAYDAFELIRPKVKSQSIEILCRIDCHLPLKVNGDPLRFRQVLINLLGNAVKFTESGEIELTLDIDEEMDDQITLHTRIRDTGIGIPADKVDTVFGAFEQADSSTTRRYGGTGLGLSICKQISHKMGGDVWAESEVGKGSTFHFTCRLRKIEEAKKFILKSLFGKKALVLDGNLVNAGILAELLTSHGMETMTITDSRLLMPTLDKAMASGAFFNLLMVDMLMPGMVEIDLAKLVRDIKSRIPSLALVAMSSTISQDIKRSKVAGFDAFLSKPVQRKRLFKVLKSVVEHGRKTAESAETVKDESAAHAPVSNDAQYSRKILLAEDHPLNQKLATYLLTRAGHQVTVVNNGQEAVEKYAAAPKDFDLIFMDVHMPVMDGLQATGAIRAWEAESGSGIDGKGQAVHIPIIAMTALAMTGDREKCLEAGMDDYVTKPINQGQLLEVIKKCVV